MTDASAETLRRTAGRGSEKSFLRKAGTDLLIAVFVFFIFVLALKISRYDLLDLHADSLIPPIPVYLADYSLTFTTKLLIGSVTKLFAEKISYDQMYTICGIANIAAVGALSLLAAELLRVIFEKKKYPALFIFALFALNAMLPQAYYPAIGCYNTYWTVLFVGLILLGASRAYPFAAPVICVIGMLVHDGFMFAFLPAVMVLLFYDCCFAESEKKKKISAVSFGVTAVLCVSLFVYASFFANAHIKMTAEEFHEYMLSRFEISFGEKRILEKINGPRLFPFSFFETYFFDIYSDPGKTSVMDPSRYISTARGFMEGRLSAAYYLKYLAAFLPFAVLFAILWGICAKKNKGIKKIPFIFFALCPFVILPLVIISTDFHRWIPAVMISQFALVYVMLKKNDPTLSELFDSPLLKKKQIAALVILCTAAYLIWLALFCRKLPMMDDIM